MSKELPQRSVTLFFFLAFASIAIGIAQTSQAPISSSSAAVAPAGSAAIGLEIMGLAEDPNGEPVNGAESHIRLSSNLLIVLNQPPPGDVSKYVLFINDDEVKGLDPPTSTNYRSKPALLFKLKRVSANEAFWSQLLGSPSNEHIDVTVSLAPLAGGDRSTRIFGAAGASAFKFQVFSGFELACAAAVILLVLIFVWGNARYRTTLRDNLLPQLAPSRQPFSLGRCQMAFWFTLIFAAFVVLFFLLQDTNTISSQALILMGISGSTAAAAVAIDVAKNSPADDANSALQALGLNTYDDVQRVQQEILNRQQELDGLPPPPSQIPTTDQRRAQLQIEINDRNSILRTYYDKTLPFVSQGWFKDVTTDINGPTVHRLQVVFWTGTLGAIFLYFVYRNLAMPPFNATLLTLMGISSGSYVGFKIQEVNN